MSTKLKPCPFCGGKAILEHIEPHSHTLIKIPDYQGEYFISCSNCTCITSACSKELAVTLWNAREEKANEKELQCIYLDKPCETKKLKEGVDTDKYREYFDLIVSTLEK